MTVKGKVHHKYIKVTSVFTLCGGIMKFEFFFRSVDAKRFLVAGSYQFYNQIYGSLWVSATKKYLILCLKAERNSQIKFEQVKVG